MRPRFGLAISLILIASVATFAQSHPAQHAHTQAHDGSSHPPMDPAQHALMHARLLGTWTGTVTSPDGSPANLALAARSGEHGELTLKASSQLKGLGATSNVSVDGQSVRWTQTLEATSCKVAATLVPATRQTVEKMNGTMACPGGELAFALTKTKN